MFNNKQNEISLSTYVTRFSLILFFFISTASFAAFDVMDEEAEGYYGNAQTREFDADIAGTEALGARDQAFLNSVQATRITNRFYIRAQVGHPKVKLNNLTNVSGGPAKSAVIPQSSFNDNLYQLLIAGGKIWQNWAFEGELFFSKRLNFALAPIIPNVPAASQISVTGELQLFALLFNLQYVLPRWFEWYPHRLQIHLDAGGGGALKATNLASYSAAGFPLDTSSARLLSLVGKLGAGARYQVAEHWLIDFSYNFFDFGKSNYDPVQGITIQSNKLQSVGYYFGATYQI